MDIVHTRILQAGEVKERQERVFFKTIMWANLFASKEQKELLGAKKGKEVADHQNLQQASAVSVNDNSKKSLR